MKVIIGSGNKNKIQSVEEIFRESPMFEVLEIISDPVSSDVSDQPLSLEETITGAKNRAKNAFNSCDLSVGIESGYMTVPHTKTGYMNVTICAIYDGKDFHLGISSAFELPKNITEFCFNENLDLEKSYIKGGLTDNPLIGQAEGAIGHLTKGRFSRKDYTKEAVRCAFIHIENKELYS